jgi:hypothetical protein
MTDADMPSHTLAEAQKETHVQYAFWIMAAVMVPVPLMVLSLSIRLRITGWKPGHQTLQESDTDSPYPPASNEYGTISKDKGMQWGQHFERKLIFLNFVRSRWRRNLKSVEGCREDVNQTEILTNGACHDSHFSHAVHLRWASGDSASTLLSIKFNLIMYILRGAIAFTNQPYLIHDPI